MDWEHARHLVDLQIEYWRSVGKKDWAEALEECLAKAERCCRCKNVVPVGVTSMQLTGPVLCRPCAATGHGVTFGQRLKAFRIAAGLTQRELAEQAGLYVDQVSTYERGQVQPERRTLAKLGGVLGVRSW